MKDCVIWGRDYSLQSSLSPAPLWLCAHTSAPSLQLAARCSVPLVTTLWVQVITRPLLLPCAPSESSSLSARRNCPLVLCWESTLAWAVQWAVLLGVGSTQGAQCSTGVLTLCCFGKNNCTEDSWGVSCQSYISVLSYSSLAAFLSL